MLPPYRDRTVLVVQRLGMSEIRAGIAVVFETARSLGGAFVYRKDVAGLGRAGFGHRSKRSRAGAGKSYPGTVINAFATSDRMERVKTASALAKTVERSLQAAHDERHRLAELGRRRARRK